jgi:hypothetical protein
MSNRCRAAMSLEECAAALGMSRQNVQLIERTALNKLRKAMGSSYRGPWRHYETEGVPEPADRHVPHESLARPHTKYGTFGKRRR